MNEQSIPIDINIGKLLEWLISRRHCKKDWHSKVSVVKKKIDKAINDMPLQEDVARFLCTIDINYFDCCKLLETLKETEADTKNLFGGYSSQRMKAWQEIMSLYEKDNLYLAEAAHMLMRNVKCDIPNLKKEIQKYQQREDYLDKEKRKYEKSEKIAQNEFDVLCKELNISGKNIKYELSQAVKLELPKICTNIAEQTKCINHIVQFYEAYIQFTNKDKYKEDRLKCLKHIIANGNTPVEKFLSKNTLESKEKEPFNIVLIEDSAEGQFEDTGITLVHDSHEPDGQNDNQFENTNYEIIDEDIICYDDESDMQNLEVYNYATPTILDHSTKTDFINDLLELEAFLKMRLYEFTEGNKDDLLIYSQMHEAPEIVQLSTLNSVQNMLDQIQCIISTMQDTKYEHLYSIKNLPSYVDTLTSSLQRKLTLVERMVNHQNAIEEKKESLKETVKTLQPILNRTIQRMKELQTEIEKDISKKYQNRIVHIKGI